MNSKWRTYLGAVLSAAILFVSSPGFAQTPSGASVISSRTGEVQGTKLHYLTAGSGPALILLHGYAGTSRMWRPILPRLAANFTVIEPALPAIRDVHISASGP